MMCQGHIHSSRDPQVQRRRFHRERRLRLILKRFYYPGHAYTRARWAMVSRCAMLWSRKIVWALKIIVTVTIERWEGFTTRVGREWRDCCWEPCERIFDVAGRVFKPASHLGSAEQPPKWSVTSLS